MRPQGCKITGGGATVTTKTKRPETLRARALEEIKEDYNTLVLRRVLGKGGRPMTQNELAVAAGIDRATVQRWENGDQDKIARSQAAYEVFLVKNMKKIEANLKKMGAAELAGLWE
jgi:ribosome-binding protein aMBF1 (putative translation factor)